MGKRMAAVAAVLLGFGARAAETPPTAPNEVRTTATMVTSGSVQVLPLAKDAKDQARISYEVMGARSGEGDLFDNGSVRCVGAFTVVNGSFEDESGNCVFTRPDGDQAFTATKGAGRLGVDSKGTWRFIGGTGKLAGIEGSGEYVRKSIRPAAQGTTQAIVKTTGTYRLPAASAAR